jgi:two-component system, LytTR family, sensor kinase
MMSALPNDSALDPVTLLGQMVGYGFSVTLSVVLAVLVWRSPRAGRDGRVIFAACAGLWSLGGLLRCGLLAAGFAPHSALLAWVEWLSFSAASFWPLGLSMLWAESADLTTDEVAAGRSLVWIAGVTGALLSIALLTAVPDVHEALATRVRLLPSADQLHMAVGYNALGLMLVGFFLVRRQRRSVPKRAGIMLMLAGPAVSIVAHAAARAGLLPFGWDALAAIVGKQSVSLTILGGVLFLGRFRAADRFARLGLRLLVAWLLAIALAWIFAGPVARMAAASVVPQVVAFAGLAAVVVGAVFLFAVLTRATDRWVEQQVFHKVDPSLALRMLREDLARAETAGAVLAVGERFVATALQLEARIVPSRESMGADDELVAVRVGTAEPYALVPTRARQALVSGELDVLHQVADLVGRRLESLEREQERLERSRREASLVHQLVEAELRALRAQINPHFLFNSLNTIAALVHQEPAIAEAMTLRLAKIFRHVLTQTERPFSSLAEEIQFLRAYLDIEQVRFGERLKVEFQVGAALGESQIPALILQPLVENAIKHGLAPKLGECRLFIGGAAENGEIVLRVRDNGVGMREEEKPASGIGMRNIRERLATLYGGRARLLFESKPSAGACATLYLPLTAR